MIPITIAAHASTAKQEAVTPTNPASIPFTTAAISSFESLSTPDIYFLKQSTVSPPPIGARAVETTAFLAYKPNEPTMQKEDPPLNANHATQRMIIPRAKSFVD